MTSPTHLLVIGAPRSGTTLLAASLGCNPEISMLVEHKGAELAVKQMVGTRIVANKLTVPNQIELAKRGRARSWLLRYLGIVKGEMLAFHSIEDYLALPDARVIGIIRDSADVVSSIMKRGEKSLAAACYRWSRAVDIMHHLTEAHSGRVMIVSFEDLVTRPTDVLTACTDFLDVPFDAKMLSGYQHNPIYPGEGGIDPGKARRKAREGKVPGLDSALSGESLERYAALQRYCRARVPAAAES